MRGEVSQLAGAHDVSVIVDPPQEPLRLGVDGDLAARVLQPVIENACRYARSWARVTVTRAGFVSLRRAANSGLEDRLALG